MEEKGSSLSKNDEVNFQISEKLMLGGTHTHYWWAIASAAQLGWGIRACKKGYVGNGSLMPLKAFSVASLFVGAAATAAFGALRASGIHTVSMMCSFSLSSFFSFGRKIVFLMKFFMYFRILWMWVVIVVNLGIFDLHLRYEDLGF